MKVHGLLGGRCKTAMASIIDVVVTMALFAPYAVYADTFEVTNTAGNVTVGSLPWAILQANANSGLDTVVFNIPGVGPHGIVLLDSLPEITDQVVIDGYTQPSSSQATPTQPATIKVELDGSLLDPGVNGLYVTCGDCTVRGLAINRFGGSGIYLDDNGGNKIEGNHIGTDVVGTLGLGNGSCGVTIYNSPSNTIGGTAPAERNVISGNDLSAIWMRQYYSNGNMILGNYIGVDATSTAAIANGDHGIQIDRAPFNTIGGTTPGTGNIISGNINNGIWLHSGGADCNVIQGNFIGIDVTGTIDLGNTGDGIAIETGSNTTIGGAATGARNIVAGNDQSGITIVTSNHSGTKVRGNYIGTDVNGTAALGNTQHGIMGQMADSVKIGGTFPGAGNIISGNGGHGIWMHSQSWAPMIQGNYIGTDVSGTIHLGNAADGIRIEESSNSIVGGADVSSGNIIAYNGLAGIVVTAGAYNELTSNIIRANGELGIDLGNDGVTGNDLGDADTGANDLQNYPVITSAIGGNASVRLEGTLNSIPNSDFILEFYANQSADASGHGEGESYIGLTMVTTDGNGDASFSLTLEGPVYEDDYVSATATSVNSNTSEFSAAILVEGLGLYCEIEAGNLVLFWNEILGAAEYHIHGESNQPFFQPGPTNLISVVPTGTTTWSSSDGVGDPEDNLTYQVIAVDDSQQELLRSTLVGELDFPSDIPRQMYRPG